MLPIPRRELEGLHEFFCGWFSGRLPEIDFESRFLARFSPDLVFIPPAGRRHGGGFLRFLMGALEL